MNNKCVYIFFDHRKKGEYVYGDYKFEYEPIYVGKGNINRPKQHKYRLNNKNIRFYSKYLKILKETNSEPLLKIIHENLTEKESNDKEIELIKIIGRIEDNGTLTNLTTGGEGTSNIKKNKNTIRKIKKISKLRYSKTIEYRKNNFIKKSNIKHNNKYDYSLVDYKNMNTIVKIICPIHGEFEQQCNSHQRGSGCPYCSNNKKSNNDEFIKKSNIKHINKYDYSLVDYKNNRTKVKLICKEHGVFEQIPENHLNGHGCPKCSGFIKNDNNMVVKKCIKKHGDKYDYSLVEYTKAHNKIKIICPIHGIFERVARDHYLYGMGCHICDKIKRNKKGDC
jgi:hypothetical protein